MCRVLMTHSLLSSWLYAIKGNPYEDATTERDPMEEFMTVLRREPTPTSEAMQNGIDFENMVTDAVNGKVWPEHAWGEAARKVADFVKGGILQYRANKPVTVAGLEMVLHGRLDVLKAGHIIDIKFSKGYERGKYFDSTQHPMYFELVPEAADFSYLVSNGTEVWTETYRREETSSIFPVISDFVSWLTAMGLLELYKEKWGAR